MIIVISIHNIHTYIQPYIQPYIHTCMHTYINIYMYTYISYQSRSYIILNFVLCIYLSLKNAFTYTATTNSRLWRVMFTNVVRSIDEIYVICEEEEGT